MQSSQSTPDQPDHSLLRDMRYTIIPHRLRGITAGLAALDLEANPDTLVTLAPDSADAVQHDALVAYTRPVTCVAAIHSRALLQFLGLQCNGSSLDTLAGEPRSADELWIGTFRGNDGAPLDVVPASVVDAWHDPEEIALAWLTTSDFAAQGLANAMADPKLTSAAITPMLRRTFETLPKVVNQWFFERAVLRANA
ncbi:hypothetical protein [Paraburkholderia sp. BCC1886]|uniref:hypothetical protein n=1 Tax=Paraburkholderia sp. BCC1886 TaxID=2562670 RepID=UPI001182C612|nr:hypothetical protein [Paraburkholderia sp. BCC1886]